MKSRASHVALRLYLRHIERADIACCQLVQKQWLGQVCQLGRRAGGQPPRPIELDCDESLGFLAEFTRGHVQGQQDFIGAVDG